MVTAPQQVNVFNPAFDVTPGELITGIITEYGVISAPYIENIKKIAENTARGGLILTMESMIRDIALAPSGKQKISWVKEHMPLLNILNKI